MRFSRVLISLVILCSVASAASRTSVYRNREYGMFLSIPSGAWLCSVPYSGANHGAAFLLGTQDESLCTKASGKRWISIFAGYNAAEVQDIAHFS